MSTETKLLEMANGSEKDIGVFHIRRKGDDFEVRNGMRKNVSCSAIVAAKILDGEFELEAVMKSASSFNEIRRRTMKIRSIRVAG